MNVEAFIAKRIGFKGKMAVLAIAISFFVIIVAMCISSGFSSGIRAGIAALTGDVVLKSSYSTLSTDAAPISGSPSYLDDIKSVKGVQSVDPVIYDSGIVKTGDDITGVVFKGTGTQALGELCTSIPSDMARELGLSSGDSYTAYFVTSEGRMKIRKFTVGDIYETPVATDMGHVVMARLQDLRRLNGWEEGEVSALEVTLDDSYRTQERMRQKAMEIGMIADAGAESEDEMAASVAAVDSYATIFDWIGLIDVNVYAILLLMTLVAGFNMVSGLLILLFRNISTIGILKSLGMTDRAIASVFLRVGSRIVAIGMAAGNILALLFCLVQGVLKPLRLNPENYYLSYVPIHVDITRILAADAASFIVIMLLLLIPSMFISRIDPASTVKTE